MFFTARITPGGTEKMLAWGAAQGCGHFVQASRFLLASGRAALDWSLP